MDDLFGKLIEITLFELRGNRIWTKAFVFGSGGQTQILLPGDLQSQLYLVRVVSTGKLVGTASFLH